MVDALLRFRFHDKSASHFKFMVGSVAVANRPGNSPLLHVFFQRLLFVGDYDSMPNNNLTGCR